MYNKINVNVDDDQERKYYAQTSVRSKLYGGTGGGDGSSGRSRGGIGGGTSRSDSCECGVRGGVSKSGSSEWS